MRGIDRNLRGRGILAKCSDAFYRQVYGIDSHDVCGFRYVNIDLLPSAELELIEVRRKIDPVCRRNDILGQLARRACKAAAGLGLASTP
jgi:hypothetical protein